jgi:general secretion pathway protein A
VVSSHARMVAFGDGPSPSLTYEPYYGLREKPFSLAADPRFLYNGPSHVRAFEQLRAGIRRREGLIVLTGEIGTGKTTLCRAVLDQLDRRTFTTFVRDPFLSREDLLKTLLIDFGVMSIADLKNGRLNGATRPDLSYPLYEFLDSLVPLQAFAVLIIDEAQNLSPSLLEEIRILSELEAREKLLQVVLVGQPELRANLKLPELRQVDQRVSVRCELAPLTREEAKRYIVHRLGIASVGPPAVEFTDAAIDVIWRGSTGIPRVINLICDRALHRGFEARVDVIEPEIVLAAIEDLGRTVDATAPAPSEPGDEATPEREASSALVDPPPSAPVREPSQRASGLPEPLEPAAHEFSDPLAEFTKEAVFAPRSGRAWRTAALVAAVVLATAVGATLWFVLAMLQSDAPVSTGMLPPRPAPLKYSASQRRDSQGSAAPVFPVAAPGGSAPYAIQVASFQSGVRTRRLLDELASAGYRAEEIEVDLGPSRGRWRQVIVGPYATAEDARADLERIRERPSYADARLVTVLTAD